jgi:hypothetical protein
MMTNLEYTDFDTALLDEIAVGKDTEVKLKDKANHLKKIADHHRSSNPWRNHISLGELIRKRLKILCKEGHIHWTGAYWEISANT